jgi:hypothetical protein
MEPAVLRCKRANHAAHVIRTAAENARIAEEWEASMRKAILLLQTREHRSRFRDALIY